MEIEQLRQELNDLLANVIDHSRNFSKGRQIPSLEIGAVLAKINKMQEKLVVWRYLVEVEEADKKAKNIQSKIDKKHDEEPVIQEQPEIINTVETPIYTQEVEVEEELILEKPEPNTNKNETVSDIMQHTPITKLVDAFNLNDRYLYANELFNKDMNAFNECIKTLDNCESLAQANEMVSSLKNQLQWDEENEQVFSFIEMVTRRFS